jgi:cytochrome bd-type quinol oxidase subunit 1
MFTTGQWTFAALFFVGFIIAMYFAYRKDKSLHQRVYKGSYKVLIAFLLFVVFLFIIKVTMKH